MIGYDEQNTILLPPRTPGSLLPKQLLEHYEQINKNNQDNVLPGVPTIIGTQASNVLESTRQDGSNQASKENIETSQENQPKKNSLKECVFVNSALYFECQINIHALLQTVFFWQFFPLGEKLS